MAERTDGGERAPKVDIRDVAKAAEVSIATVSRVLSGRGSTAAATRERVQRVATELGYRPNEAGRALRTRRSGAVALMISSMNNAFYAAIATEIEQRLTALGYATLFGNTNEEPELQDQFLEEVASRSVSAVLMLCAVKSPRIERLAAHQPCLLVNRRLKALRGCSFVGIDDYQAARQLAEAIVGRGARRIGVLRGPAYSETSAARFRGLRERLGELGMPLEEESVVEARLSIASGYQAAAELLGGRGRFDALFCGSDEIAYGAWRTLPRAVDPRAGGAARLRLRRQSAEPVARAVARHGAGAERCLRARIGRAAAAALGRRVAPRRHRALRDRAEELTGSERQGAAVRRILPELDVEPVAPALARLERAAPRSAVADTRLRLDAEREDARLEGAPEGGRRQRGRVGAKAAAQPAARVAYPEARRVRRCRAAVDDLDVIVGGNRRAVVEQVPELPVDTVESRRLAEQRVADVEVVEEGVRHGPVALVDDGVAQPQVRLGEIDLEAPVQRQRFGEHPALMDLGRRPDARADLPHAADALTRPIGEAGIDAVTGQRDGSGGEPSVQGGAPSRRAADTSGSPRPARRAVRCDRARR